ncbi:TIGR03619 family F420-dependent LLM class oxidoreductase [Myxococcota bacterium]|nr:TIGR03619 family F420-dependent LLM class oxidoreductase [Myxococcota bacterium]
MSIAISITLSNLSELFGDDLAALVETARIADAEGIDQLALADHLAIGTGTDHYPYGRYPYDLDEPWMEPLTSLAAIAGATSRVRLATGVLIAPLRPPLLLAKTAATLDVLSQGRLDLGVGTGWHEAEFAAAGAPFEKRGARMDDTLRACLTLWNHSPASFESETVSFTDLRCLPHPRQDGGVPLWFGGGLHPANLRRMLEFGARWLPAALGNSDEVGQGIGTLRRALTEAGRDASTLQVRAGLKRRSDAAGNLDLDATLAGLESLEERGVTLAALGLRGFVRDSREIRPFLEGVSARRRRV